MAWNPKSGKQHPPAAGAHSQKPVSHGGDKGGNQFVHESLKGEQKPDKSAQGKRTYG